MKILIATLFTSTPFFIPATAPTPSSAGPMRQPSSAPPVYEQATHQVLAERAAKRSRNLRNVLQDLDLDGALYPPGFLLQANGAGGGVLVGDRSAVGLISAGAVLEDGVKGTAFDSKRPKNHFFDPTIAAGGSPPDFSSGFPLENAFGVEASPNWALGAGGNAFSWTSAHEAFERALTAGTRAEREDAEQELFITLGMVIHLLQDLYQPSHVRADPHLCFHFDALGPLGQAAGFLLTGCAAIEGAGSRHVNPGGLHPQIAAVLNGTLPVRHNTFLDHFLDAAEDVNSNFFSDDTIFEDYPAPSDSTTHLETCGFLDILPDYSASDSLAIGGQSVRLAYIPLNPLCQVAIALGFEPSNCFTLFDAPCDSSWTPPGHVLLENLMSLLPGAVAQSEALIDYFFRGRIQATLLENGSLRVKNIAADAEQGRLQDGTFSFFIEREDETREPLPGVADFPLPGVLDVGQDLEITGDFAGALASIPGDDKRIIVLYSGPIGTADVGSVPEDAIAAARVAVSAEISLVLSFDVSGSISGLELEGAKQAALSLLPILEGGEDNRIAVHAFSSAAGVVLGFTSDIASAEASITNLNPGGATALFDAAVLAGGEASGEANAALPEDRTVVVILFTDGLRNSSNASFTSAAEALSSVDHPEIDEAFLVFVGSDGSGSSQLSDLAAAAGRQSFDVQDFDQLETIFLNLLQGN